MQSHSTDATSERSEIQPRWVSGGMATECSLRNDNVGLISFRVWLSVDRQSRPEIMFLLKVEDLPEGDQNGSVVCSLWDRSGWRRYCSIYSRFPAERSKPLVQLPTKYAWSSMKNGVKVYNSRRPISKKNNSFFLWD